jgi:hypothetical protein
MSVFKGTKGSWRLKDNYIFSEDNKSIAVCQQITFNHDIRGRRIEDTEVVFNAKLISCAPEMLEMLELFTDFPNDDFKVEEKNQYYIFSIKVGDMIKAKELIKKATEL